MTQEVTILILLLSMLLSAFFAGVEMAFVSSNKFKVELDKNRGNFTGRLLAIVSKSPSRFIGTMLIGNNISLVIYGLMAAALMEPPLEELFAPYLSKGYLDAVVVISQTVLSTLLILIMAEFLPKAISSLNPNRFLNLFILPTTFFYYLLYLFVSFTVFLSNVILRYIFRVKIRQEEVSFERTDLNYYLKQASGKPGQKSAHEVENEVMILRNVLEFPSVRARECMVPRTEIIAVDISESVEELRRLFIEHGLSKIMVYRESIDEIIGFVHSFEIFKKPTTIQSVMIPVLIVPETMFIKDILTQFIQQHKSVAVVVDEYGGTSGIITTEDIIEQIFGEIDDEHDVEELSERKISDIEYVFSARLEIDYLNDHYGFNLPENEAYSTLAGMLLHYRQSIPEKGEVIEIERFKFTITGVSDTRIHEVTLLRKEN